MAEERQVHFLVNQLYFARQELKRVLEGVTPTEASQRLEPMNSIGWILGHLANQENNLWVLIAQGQTLMPDLHQQVGPGQPASTPGLDDMWNAWETVTDVANRYLETLTSAEQLQAQLEWKGEPIQANVGTLLLRNIYHYWFHIGEIHAIRQQLGHKDLPDYVGDMAEFAYFPEV